MEQGQKGEEVKSNKGEKMDVRSICETLLAYIGQRECMTPNDRKVILLMMKFVMSTDTLTDTLNEEEWGRIQPKPVKRNKLENGKLLDEMIQTGKATAVREGAWMFPLSEVKPKVAVSEVGVSYADVAGFKMILNSWESIPTENVPDPEGLAAKIEADLEGAPTTEEVANVKIELKPLPADVLKQIDQRIGDYIRQNSATCCMDATNDPCPDWRGAVTEKANAPEAARETTTKPKRELSPLDRIFDEYRKAHLDSILIGDYDSRQYMKAAKLGVEEAINTCLITLADAVERIVFIVTGNADEADRIMGDAKQELKDRREKK